MYILIELSEMPKLCERVRHFLDPDSPPDPLFTKDDWVNKTVTELISQILNSHGKPPGTFVIDDEGIVEFAKGLILGHVTNLFKDAKILSIELLNDIGDVSFKIDQRNSHGNNHN